MPPTRGRPIALKLLALLLVPLLSLAGLWAFAAGLTGGDGLRLLAINDLASKLATPSEQVNLELQNERLVSVRLLVTGTGADTVTEQRGRTDRTVAAYRRLSSTVGDVSPAMSAQLREFNGRLGDLTEIRRELDKGGLTPLETVARYSDIVEASFRMYDAMILVPDRQLYQQARAVTMLGEAKEMLSRERALIIVVLDKGRIGAREREAFTGMAATRRLLFAQALSHLDSDLRGPFAQVAASPAYQEFLRVEDVVKGRAATDSLPPAAATWPTDGQNLWTAVERDQTVAVKAITERVTPAAVAVLVKLGVAGGAGLVVVVASVLISLRFRKRLVRELAGLREAAVELADVRLAELVRRLRKNTEPPTAEEVPPLRVETRTSEIEDIVQAFNEVQSTAVEAAVDQARLRHGVSQVFVNLARRNQSLLHRQLLQLNGMQRATEQPELLSDLFKLDHLTTRMRRHAESLIILSDQTPGRGWRHPVPIHDVIRAAIAEVEEYERVEVLQPPGTALIGSAVTDVVHLLAELVENATLFSPPQTKVDVRSSTTPDGFVIEVEDRGLGLPREELDALNNRLVRTPEFDLAQSDRLGLFVVSRLAARHDIKVLLTLSPYGGVTARVSLPSSLLAEDPVPAVR
ncbi:Signal transduction histidine kinase [Nonomuraea maritima]|uniref:histidine kinase n=1 Tax=Nonomuraea maritima TaxID=683260 RepID=A0A1G9QP80_9ACTN|nr:nitrate- and nitrite sensing domain-containing protein [Nonomuraea maritima]SDM12809.1 Signal transduction histidine kinase [Nonomuraea maritima]